MATPEPRRLRRGGGDRGEQRRPPAGHDRRRHRRRASRSPTAPPMARCAGRPPAGAARRCWCTAPAGGVGLAAVECGQALGARVIATARGADAARASPRRTAPITLIDTASEDVRARVKELTEGRGADVVFDPVGGELFKASLRSIAWEGRILVIGFASGADPADPGQPPAGQERRARSASTGAATASTIRRACARRFEELLRWHAEGRIRPHVSELRPLAEARDALELLLARQSTGKIVLTHRRRDVRRRAMAGRMVVVQGDITEAGGRCDRQCRQRAPARRRRGRRRDPSRGRARAARRNAAGSAAARPARRGSPRATELPARYVIHTVGPGLARRRPGRAGAARRVLSQLARARRRANGVRTIAFPGISTGVYGYPLEAATRLAMPRSGLPGDAARRSRRSAS